jgi:hypothetical protein
LPPGQPGSTWPLLEEASEVVVVSVDVVVPPVVVVLPVAPEVVLEVVPAVPDIDSLVVPVAGGSVVPEVVGAVAPLLMPGPPVMPEPVSDPPELVESVVAGAVG